MKFSYRISKYLYLDADNNLRSPDGEWTSFHDIKESADQEKYLAVESSYVELMLGVCRALNVSSLQIKELEDADDLSNLEEDDEIPLSKAGEVIQGILREMYWCKLVDRALELHFGYDYCFYIVCNSDVSSTLMKLNKQLLVQEFCSPYLDS